MKKSIKSVLAKSLAVVMAFSLAGIAPNTSSDAASKKPTLPKKVTVNVGKKKTVKVKSKKKVKKTTWSLNKKGKKVVSLSKKKKKSVVVKGKKTGKATLTAKIKVGKKTYKKTCKITVKKAKPKTTPKTTTSTTKATPTTNTNKPGGNTGGSTSGGDKDSKPTPRPTPAVPPASSLTVNGKTLTVDEKSAYRLDLTELNETTLTCDAKKPIGAIINENEVKTTHDDILYNRDGSVTFTSNADCNSGLSYYINPCTSEDQLIDISEKRGGKGYWGYQNGTKDVFDYDYVRVVLSSESEMNCRTYNDNEVLETQGFPGGKTSETYEAGWVGPAEDYMEAGSKSEGMTVKADYVTRTVFIPVDTLMDKGVNPATLTAIAFCPQANGEEVTIYDIAFVKVNYDTKVTGINVTSNKTALKNGKVATCTAEITPEDATRKRVKWTSSNEELATVNYKGQVTAAAEGSGKVTITATATDGSNVTGSVEITIGDTVDPGPGPVVDEYSPVIGSDRSATLNLAAPEIVASSNDGSATVTDKVTKNADGIKYAGAYTMQMLDISAYLTKYELDLADYATIEITGKLLDESGAEVTCEAGKAKTCLVAKANLNGHADGMNSSKYKNFPTINIDLSDIEAASLADAAGFNIQLTVEESMKAYETMLISGIKLIPAVDEDAPVVDDTTGDVTLALGAEGIVGSSNDGSATVTDKVTKDTEGIKYAGAYTMQMLDISAYLTKYELDLSDYAAIEITGKLLDESGAEVTCEAGKAKTCLVAKANLNGHADGMNSSKYKNFPTINIDLSGIETTDLADAAGFNIQLTVEESMKAYDTMLISSIKLIKTKATV